MIVGILTPCRASKKDDVRIRMDILRKIKEYPVGLEIVGPVDDFLDEERRQAIMDNIREVGQGLDYLVIHAPVERINYSLKHTNLSTNEGLETLKIVDRFARLIGANLLILHAEILSSATEIGVLTGKERKKLKEKIKENLKLVSHQGVKLGIENMPYPLMGDMIYILSEMVWDPLFADPLELYEFVGEIGVSMVFDTCHYGTLNFLLSLKTMVNKIKDRVSHLHLSDYWGKWLSGTSVFKEGLIPGDGFLGEEQFRELLQFLKDDSRDYTLTLEVRDSDFRDPKESRESIRRVVSWIS